MKPSDVNDVIEKIADDLIANISDDADKSVDVVYEIRSKIDALLLEYSNKDGTISEHRIRTLLRELDSLDFGLGEELTKKIEETTEQTSNHLIEALAVVVGTTFVTNAIVSKEVKDYVFKRTIDGITLDRRVRAISGLLQDTVQQAIRYGVLTGESAHSISRRVKKALDRAAWQVKRVITTEVPIALRKTIAVIGDKSGIVKGVKIIDNRGRHKNHESHECYRLAEQNKYGMGKGVYLPTDTFIFDPHPQCSAYFRYIFNDKLLEGGDS